MNNKTWLLVIFLGFIWGSSFLFTEILLNYMNNQSFESKYIHEEDKKYFLNNVKDIKIYKGKVNEIAIIKKNN